MRMTKTNYRFSFIRYYCYIYIYLFKIFLFYKIKSYLINNYHSKVNSTCYSKMFNKISYFLILFYFILKTFINKFII